LTAWLTGFTVKNTDALGQAAFADLNIDTPGVYRLQAASTGIASGFSNPITIYPGNLLASVATGDPSWLNHIDGVDVLFLKSGSNGTTTYRLKNTNPGTFKYQLSLTNETGTEIHIKGRELPSIIKDGVTLKDHNGATTTVYLTVPSMPANVGTTSPLTAAQQTAPAFVLSGSRPVRAYPTEGSESDHESRHDELSTLQISWIAELPAGVTSCANVTAWNTTPLVDNAIVRCIKIEGIEIKKHGEAHIRVNYEFRWKDTPGWGGPNSDATVAFRAGFNFISTTQVKLDSFNTDLLAHSRDHWSHLPQALKDKLISDFAALWNTTYTGSHALGLAFAGEKVTALGGFLFDASGAGRPDITVRAFSSTPAAGTACTTTTNLAGWSMTGPDGFWFISQIGDNSVMGPNSLPSGFKYYLALCDFTVGQTAMPFAQMYWPGRAMNHTLGSKEFNEEDFFVSGPTRLAFQSQSIVGRKGINLGTVKVALLDAFGNIVTVDSTSKVTLSAVTAAGNSTALSSYYSASQPLVDRTLSSGTASWTGLRFSAAGLYKLNAASSVPGVPDEKSLPINISN
jgi:hypothetical protein